AARASSRRRRAMPMARAATAKATTATAAARVAGLAASRKSVIRACAGQGPACYGTANDAAAGNKRPASRKRQGEGAWRTTWWLAGFNGGSGARRARSAAGFLARAGALGGGLAGRGRGLRRARRRRMGRVRRPRRPAAGRELAHFRREGLDAGGQRFDLGAAGYAQAVQGTLDAVLEHLLQPVPCVGGALAHLADTGLHRATHRVHLAAGHAPRALLEGAALAHQRVEQLAAFLLGAGEGAHAGQPDLLGMVEDRSGRAFQARLDAVGTGCRLRGGLELGHGTLLVAGQGAAGAAVHGATMPCGAGVITLD